MGTDYPIMSISRSLRTLGGVGSWAYDLNDSGQVVGLSYTSDARKHAFLYENDTMKDLGTLGGSESEATDTNDSGQAVGWSYILRLGAAPLRCKPLRGSGHRPTSSTALPRSTGKTTVLKYF